MPASAPFSTLYSNGQDRDQDVLGSRRAAPDSATTQLRPSRLTPPPPPRLPAHSQAGAALTAPSEHAPRTHASLRVHASPRVRAVPNTSTRYAYSGHLAQPPHTTYVRIATTAYRSTPLTNTTYRGENGWRACHTHDPHGTTKRAFVVESDVRCRTRRWASDGRSPCPTQTPSHQTSR